MIDYVREMAAEKSYRFDKYGSVKHFFLLFWWKSLEICVDICMCVFFSLPSPLPPSLSFSLSLCLCLSLSLSQSIFLFSLSCIPRIMCFFVVFGSLCVCVICVLMGWAFACLDVCLHEELRDGTQSLYHHVFTLTVWSNPQTFELHK